MKRKIIIGLIATVLVGGMAAYSIKAANTESENLASNTEVTESTETTTDEATPVEETAAAPEEAAPTQDQATAQTQATQETTNTAQTQTQTQTQAQTSAAKSSSTSTPSQSQTTPQKSSTTTQPTQQTQTTTTPKATVKAGINQSLTDGVNAISSINGYNISNKVSYFKDITKQVATGSLSEGSAENKIKSALASGWNDTCNINNGNATYTIKSVDITILNTGASTAKDIVGEQLRSGKRVSGDYAYNVVYTNSDGSNKVVRLAVRMYAQIPQ